MAERVHRLAVHAVHTPAVASPLAPSEWARKPSAHFRHPVEAVVNAVPRLVLVAEAVV